MGTIDDLTKNYIRQNDKFADICNFVMFQGEQVVDPNELEEQDTTELEVILGEGKSASVQKLRDVLKKTVVKSDGKAMYVIVGVENQREVHYAMAVKGMVYDALNYANQVEKIAKRHKEEKDLKGAEFLSGFSKKDKLIPVVTITIYWNSGKWDGPRSLFEMFDVTNEEILQYVPDYKMNLIVPDEIEDFSKFATELKSVFEIVGVSDDKREFVDYCNNSLDTEISYEAANLLDECLGTRFSAASVEGGPVKMCKAVEDLTQEIKTGELVSLVKDGVISKEVAAERLGLSLEEFEALAAKA